MGNKCELIFSLDAASKKEFIRQVESTESVVNIYKVGLVPFTLLGTESIQILKNKKKKIFLDLKFHDIPNTMIKSSLNSIAQGIDIMDFHLCGDENDLKNTLDTIRQYALKEKISLPLFIGVTVLTSVGKESKIRCFVSDYVEKAVRSGFNGVVLSGREAPFVREKWGDEIILICPGIRIDEETKGSDQKRVVTPEKVKKYADFAVVGRPIYQASDPEKAASDIIERLK